MLAMKTLYLHFNSLSGILPPQWSGMANMMNLALYNNSLSGTLPPEWSTLSSLWYLELNDNSISGTLPPQWSHLSNLQTLYLNFNSLSGTLPFEWSNLTSMQSLALHNNLIAGTLPPEWSNLTSLTYLWLHYNNLDGTLPPQWGSMSAMESLSLYSNSLSGILPLQWSNLTNMQTLYLHFNCINGTLPPEWGCMTSMQSLHLYSNSLSGTLPPQWSNMTSLEYLGLESNSFSGTLPPEWSRMRNLKTLESSTNFLSGTLPSLWGNMTNIKEMHLSSNSLTDTLPPEWANMRNLEILGLDSNSLGGTLPLEWGSMSGIKWVYLCCNFFSGTLPPQWGTLTSLLHVALNKNSLSGTLPSDWGNLTNLQILYLHLNSLSGTLPTEWRRMINMQTLCLHFNTLSGTLPPQWSNLTNLQTLYLHVNSLSGTLPPQWSRLTSLQIFYLHYNILSGSLPTLWHNLPKLQTLYLHFNFLNGTLPSDWSNMTSMTVLQLSSNSFSGTLPPQWSNLTNMYHLDLSSNFLNGNLPPEWSKLTSMQSLALNNNIINGTLPPKWGTLRISLDCHVEDNCLDRRNATPWWLNAEFRIISPQGFKEDCVVLATHSRSASGASLSTSASRSNSLSTLAVSVSFRTSSSRSFEVQASTERLLVTSTLTPLCSAPPFRFNSSLRIVDATNESVCRDHVCPTFRYNADGGVALAVAYDSMASAQSLLLLLAEDGVSGEWLSLLPSVRFGMVMLDTVAESGAPNLTLVGVVVLRPGSGWPGLEVRPYAVQRLPLVVSLRCVSANGTVVSHPSEMVLVVAPRSMPVAASVQAVVQSSQAIAGGLGSGGGAEALTMGRLATSLSLLSCDDALQGYGAGLGVLSVSGDLLAAVDTIVGNVVFVAGAAVAAALVVCGLYLCASSRCSFAACYRDVLRLPLALFPIFAATLPSTVMAVVAVLRDVPVLTGGSASGAYCSVVAAATIWGGALVVVGSATRRMALLGTLRPTCGVAPAFASIFMLNSAFRSSTEWVSPRPADISLFEGTTVLWFLPLDVCLTVAMAVVSALPLSRSHALCVGVNAVNVGGCAAMLAVAALRRPFSTHFGRIHSVVTYVLVLALAVIGLFLSVASSRETYPRLLLAVGYLSGGAAVMSALKAVIDLLSTVAATQRRLLESSRTSPQSQCRDDLVVTLLDYNYVPTTQSSHRGHRVPASGETDIHLDYDVMLQAEAIISSDEDSTTIGHQQDRPLVRGEGEGTRLLHPLGELLDAYQHLVSNCVKWK